MITLSEAQERVRALAAEQPHKTASCQYFDRETGAPCCIVGHAFADELREAGVDADPYLNTKIVPLLGGLFDQAAKNWLHAVQYSQDQGIPWGEAVELADEG